MLGLWSIGSSPLSLRLHIAFRGSIDDVTTAVPTLKRTGITPRAGGGGMEIDEPMVFAWMPAAAVYFDDPDGHSLELIAMLPDAPQPELGFIPLSA